MALFMFLIFFQEEVFMDFLFKNNIDYISSKSLQENFLKKLIYNGNIIILFYYRNT